MVGVTIQVSEKLWRFLNKQKKRGDTFESVIWNFIEFKNSERRKK